MRKIKVISIPNGDVTASSIVNYSADPIRRVDLTIGVSYDCPTDKVRAAFMAAAAADSRVLSDPEPFAAISEYKDSCINYVFRVWCKSDDYWDVYFAMNEAVRDSFQRSGVEMTYNHLNVHIVEK